MVLDSLRRRRPAATLEQHDADLKSAGLYYDVQARLREQERDVLARERDYREDERPLLVELHAAGYDVTGVWDLVNLGRRYPNAIPVLIRHVDGPYPSVVREGIARALATRDARHEWRGLTERYVHEMDERVKGGLAAALGAIADKTTLDDLTSLAADPRNGRSRILLLRALARFRDARARRAVEDLQNDPDLRTAVHEILRRRGRNRT